MMHFLGGTVLGSVFFWGGYYELPDSFRKKYFTYGYALVFVLVLGLAWEFFEYQVGIDREYSRVHWAFDSVKDLIMDVIGGSVAYWTLKRLFWKNG